MAKEIEKKEKYGMVPISIFDAMRDNKSITPSVFVVYSAIATFANKHSGTAYPSNTRLAAMTGFTINFISRAITALIDAGLIKTKDKRKSGKRNFYFLLKHPIGIGSDTPDTPDTPDASDDLEEERLF